jgi:hypothetical protein
VHKVHEELMRMKQQLAKEREEKEAALAMLQSYQCDTQRQQVRIRFARVCLRLVVPPL